MNVAPPLVGIGSKNPDEQFEDSRDGPWANMGWAWNGVSFVAPQCSSRLSS